jgi:hypothetical protein
MAVLAAGLAGCTAARNVWRPEGDGGWSAAKRREAVSTLAPQAGVVDPLAAPTPAPGPTVYNLAAALAEARGGNRPMQAEALRVGIARQRALEARRPACCSPPPPRRRATPGTATCAPPTSICRRT